MFLNRFYKYLLYFAVFAVFLVLWVNIKDVWKSPEIPQFLPPVQTLTEQTMTILNSEDTDSFEEYAEKRTTMKTRSRFDLELNSTKWDTSTEGSNSTEKIIIVVTPTYKRLTRIADFTRMANTLSHIANLHWIVIEDSITIAPPIHNILVRTNLPFTYLSHSSPPNFPNRGWYQRTMALKHIRENYTEIVGDGNGVVYFGDDDNSYDLRLFTEYIRNVKRFGMWGVGHVAGSLVETPSVSNQTVIGFEAQWSPDRYFAIDMAGFALGLQLILESDAVFQSSCPSGTGALESCLLEDLGLRREDIEPFGFDREEKEVLVWHTKTAIPDIWDLRRSFWQLASPPKTNGYFVEY